MEIKSITSSSFHQYGRVITGLDIAEISEKMKETPLPEDVIYVPSVSELECLLIAGNFTHELYGGLPMQIGYCNGHNKKLNAVEYHRSSEFNIAITDLVLILGRQQDIQENDTYDTNLMEAFFVPAGTVLEVYATTLHYAPCHTEEEGFRCVVILPKDTNTKIDFKIKKQGESKLLFAKNKWLIAHKEAGLEKDGAHIGLIGENLSI